MKLTSKILSLLLILTIFASLFASCEKKEKTPEHIDYASTVTLDMNSATAKAEVTVKAYIDGDTTHFYVPKDISSTGVLKARYISINTPESTGKIEEWGKKASNFTKEKLMGATSIIVESDTAEWNLDSTGDRHLVWVWYKDDSSPEYRNLNIEILQNGLAIASNSGQNIYGSVCLSAIDQAKRELLNVHSEGKDPDFWYGDSIPLDIKELRLNVKDYVGAKVSFEGVVTMNEGEAVYVESYDNETEMYYGMYIYYGYSLSGDGLEILTVGNRVKIVGTVQYYETGNTYQVSGLQYRAMKPNDPNNIQKLDDEKHAPAYVLTDPSQFKDGKVTMLVNDEEKTFNYADLSLYTSVEMKNLKVVDVYTTSNEDSSSKGAMTLTCFVNGIEISVRTTVLYDDAGNLVTASYFNDKTIDVKGMVDFYNSDYSEDFPYQIKIFSVNDVTIH